MHPAKPPWVIARMKVEDWASVRAIYLEGIATGNATFEKSPPEWREWDAQHLKSCRFVARSDPEILGWAALRPVSSRCVYAGVAELSVYVAAATRGRRLGSKLLAALVEASEREGIWTLQAGISPENIASIEAHKRAGFGAPANASAPSTVSGGTWYSWSAAVPLSGYKWRMSPQAVCPQAVGTDIV